MVAVIRTVLSLGSLSTLSIACANHNLLCSCFQSHPHFSWRYIPPSVLLARMHRHMCTLISLSPSLLYCTPVSLPPYIILEHHCCLFSASPLDLCIYRFLAGPLGFANAFAAPPNLVPATAASKPVVPELSFPIPNSSLRYASSISEGSDVSTVRATRCALGDMSKDLETW